MSVRGDVQRPVSGQVNKPLVCVMTGGLHGLMKSTLT